MSDPSRLLSYQPLSMSTAQLAAVSYLRRLALCSSAHSILLPASSWASAGTLRSPD